MSKRRSARALETLPPGIYNMTVDAVLKNGTVRYLVDHKTEDSMAKKKTRKVVVDSLAGMAFAKPGTGKEYPSFASLLNADLRSLYFGPSIDVPSDVLLAPDNGLGLRKKQRESINTALAAAYRAGFKKGEDESAKRAEQTRAGEQRSNEDRLRHVTRAVARAIEALVPVLKNNEAAGSSTFDVRV